MYEPNLQDGEVYVEGRSEETARKLYEAAKKAGIDQSRVFTTSHGYVAPKEVVDSIKGVDAQDIELNAPNGYNVAKEENQHVTATGINDAEGDKEITTDEDAVKAREADESQDETEIVEVSDDVAQDEADGGDPSGNRTHATADENLFDPTDHTVEQVKEYLGTADETERNRVIAAEEASDKPRRGIVKLADEEEGDK